MIEVRVESGTPTAHGVLPGGAIAFLDPDWIPPDGGEASVLIVSPGGTACWSGEPRVTIQMEGSPEAIAGRVLGHAAAEVSRVAAGVPPALVRVQGRGLLSHRVRAHLGVVEHDSAPSRPRVIVDMTGDPSAIVRAIEAVDDLGLVVLAGGFHGTGMSLDLYPDLHARGLRLIGLPLSLPDQASIRAGAADELARWIGEAARPLRLGTPMSDDARLYELMS